MTVEMLTQSQIVVDSDVQLKARGIDQQLVYQYREAIKAGIDLGFLVVFYDGVRYVLGDGLHRLTAHQFEGTEKIACEVRPGGKTDAMLLASTANAVHGRQMSSAERREAAERLARLAGKGDLEISHLLGVNRSTVFRWREEWSADVSDKVVLPGFEEPKVVWESNMTDWRYCPTCGKQQRISHKSLHWDNEVMCSVCRSWAKASVWTVTQLVVKSVEPVEPVKQVKPVEKVLYQFQWVDEHFEIEAWPSLRFDTEVPDKVCAVCAYSFCCYFVNEQGRKYCSKDILSNAAFRELWPLLQAEIQSVSEVQLQEAANQEQGVVKPVEPVVEVKRGICLCPNCKELKIQRIAMGHGFECMGCFKDWPSWWFLLADSLAVFRGLPMSQSHTGYVGFAEIENFVLTFSDTLIKNRSSMEFVFKV